MNKQGIVLGAAMVLMTASGYAGDQAMTSGSGAAMGKEEASMRSETTTGKSSDKMMDMGSDTMKKEASDKMMEKGTETMQEKAPAKMMHP